jgi:hypothetical protein
VRVRGRLWGILLLAALVAFGGWVFARARWRPLELAGEPPADGYARASGVVHVHTTLSDGGGTPEEVIAAARAAGLDFLALSDHNNVDALPFEGEHDGVLVLVGSELSTTAGHVLGLGLERDPQYRFSGGAMDALEDIRDLGGFAFAAHPFSARSDLRFTGWDLPGPWGLELMNGDSEWRKAGPRLLLTVGLYRLNARYALLQTLSAPDEALDRWDEMLRRRDVVGLYGADAHSRLPITKSVALRFPSYRALFDMAREHLLLERPLTGRRKTDRAAVLSALRSGRFYLGLDGLAPADGFSFTVRSASGRQWTMGESVTLPEAGLVARAGGRVPRGSHVRLLRDGETVAEGTEVVEAPLLSPGVYRAEVRVDGWPVPWVVSNPVAVFAPEILAARKAAAAWPEPPAPDGPVEILDSFDGQTVFSAGHDPASTMEEPLLDPTGGIGGSGAARIGFHLGLPTEEKPHVFVAIVSWEHRNLTGKEGLAFRIRADGVYRAWVQVRDENPASTDEGTEWWFASVKTSAAWRQVAVPFASLRSINPHTDGRLDLDKVRALVFVIDKGAMKPGSRGTIWIDDLGVY